MQKRGLSAPALVRPARSLSRALNALTEEKERVLEDLGRLLEADTSFPPGAGYGAFADLLERLVRPLGFRVRRVSVPKNLWDPGDCSAWGERVNLIAERPTGQPAVNLYFHVDTVPPGDGWSRSPFALTVEDDRLYGRGAADMKGTIAAALAALRAAQASSLPLAYEVVLLFCTDEEGGLYPGIRYLAEGGGDRPHLESQRSGGAAPLRRLVRQP